MANRIERSAKLPIRENLSYDECWNGPDRGLIWCWERGRRKQLSEPEIADRAKNGELIVLAWKGGAGTAKKLKEKPGTLRYLATWQGLRGDDLNIDLDGKHPISCAKTGITVVFQAGVIIEDEPSES
ncbi:MAG: hypothetical protein WD065_15610 [Planctomycetaceae bacterium]